MSLRNGYIFSSSFYLSLIISYKNIFVLIFIVIMLLGYTDGLDRLNGSINYGFNPRYLPSWLLENEVSSLFLSSNKITKDDHCFPQREIGSCVSHNKIRHKNRKCKPSTLINDSVAIERLCLRFHHKGNRNSGRFLKLSACNEWGMRHAFTRSATITECFTKLTHLLSMDLLAESLICNFRKVLNKGSCSNVSNESSCAGCEEAYRRWVCSQLFIYYDGAGCPVQPCSSICHCVEQKCPYFLPQDKPVAGEPSFLCEDPSVVVEDTLGAHSSSTSRCYEPCAPHASLGRLHEKTNMTSFALCLRGAGRRSQRECDFHTSEEYPQCLSAPDTDCGGDTPSSGGRLKKSSASGGVSLLILLTQMFCTRTLLSRSRDFT